MGAKVACVLCSEQGAKTVSVPWADMPAQFTAAFEAYTIEWPQDTTSISVVVDRMGASWTMIAKIMERAVGRGLARRADRPVKRIHCPSSAE